VSLLTAAVAWLASGFEEQRLTRAFMTPKVWPVTSVSLSPPVTAALTTDLGGAFLHYTFAILPGSADVNELEKRLAGVNFTIRLLDKDGFTILLTRPGEVPTLYRRPDGRLAFRLEDVVGCSLQIYSQAASWSVDWEGR
jgi:hypothetical protein